MFFRYYCLYWFVINFRVYFFGVFLIIFDRGLYLTVSYRVQAIWNFFIIDNDYILVFIFSRDSTYFSAFPGMKYLLRYKGNFNLSTARYLFVIAHLGYFSKNFIPIIPPSGREKSLGTM